MHSFFIIYQLPNTIKMKDLQTYFIATFLILLLGSCSDNEEQAMDTEWILVEQLLDTGDGSGGYMPVQSDKIITLNADSTFSSNGDLCTMSILTEIVSSGSYDPEFIIPDSCFSTPRLKYEISANELIITYPCIEPCGHKYMRN